MSDATHNTLVTILLVIAAVIVFTLLMRWFNTGTFYRYSYQPASAIEIYRDREYVPVTSQSSVVTYSRPSYSYSYVPHTTTQYESSTYQYGYTCTNDGHCWTY